MDNKTDWRIEKLLEGMLTLVIIAALVGAFGGYAKPNTVQASNGDIQLTAEYHRISRNGASEPLVVHVRNKGNAPTDEVEIRLTRRYLQGFNLAAITPSPESETTDDHDLVLIYGELGPHESKAVQISLESEFPGRHRAVLRAIFPGRGPATVRFSTLVLP